MKIAVVGTNDYQNNKIFSSIGKTVKMENLYISRQDGNSGLTELKKLFDKNNIIIRTDDLFDKKENIDIEFHVNGSFKKKTNAKITYCIHPEIYLVDKNCHPKFLKKKYDKIFTNIEKDIDNIQFIELQVPQGLTQPIKKIYPPKHACIIASNKNLNKYYKQSGYSMRSKLIKWSQKNKKNLDVYGPDWNIFFSSNYYLNRILKYSQKKLNFKLKTSSNFKGVCQNKIKTMMQYKFSFCFENVYDVDGYFTQGFFDTLINGCVPIYLGPKNVNKYVPNNCFIDFRKFSNFENLFNHLDTLSEKEYFDYINNIKIFLNSEKYKKFSPDTFANTILRYSINEKL